MAKVLTEPYCTAGCNKKAEAMYIASAWDVAALDDQAIKERMMLLEISKALLEVSVW